TRYYPIRRTTSKRRPEGRKILSTTSQEIPMESSISWDWRVHRLTIPILPYAKRDLFTCDRHLCSSMWI
ncbi:hypothetical protein AAMO2058_000130200, partial [Amorphochlora amoebiformis]